MCRREAPTVVEASKIQGVSVVGVGGRGQSDALEAGVTQFGIDSFPNIADRGELWARFGVYAQPAFVVVTAEGNVLGHMGDLDLNGIRDLVDRARAA